MTKCTVGTMTCEEMQMQLAEPSHRIGFYDYNKEVITIDFDASPISIVVANGIDMTDAAKMFLNLCAIAVGAKLPFEDFFTQEPEDNK